MSVNKEIYGTQSNIEPNADKNGSFDFLYWLFKVINYWYLFVIFFILAIGLAYLKNQYWVPLYNTTSTIIIENNGGRKNDLTAGFSMGQGVQSTSNQLIMYQSYDLISKAIDDLGVTNEIFEKTRFKEENRYKSSAINIYDNYVHPSAYSMAFSIKGLTDSTYQISYVGDKVREPFTKKGKYGESIQHPLFFLTVEKTELFENNPHYSYFFRFLTKSGLIASYRSRLQCRLRDGSSVMEVSVVGNVAERDKDFITVLNDRFFADNLSKKNNAAEKSIDFIDKQLMIIKDSLDASELKLNAYQTQSGLYGEGRTARANSELEELGKKKSDLKYRQDYFKFLSDYLKRNTHNETLMTPSIMGFQDPQLTGLVNTYNDLIFKQSEYGEGSPLWLKNKKQIEDVNARLSEILKTIPSSLAMEEQNLNARYAKAMGEIATLPERERKLLIHERDFKINDTYYNYLLQRRVESQILKASNAPDNVLLDQPRIITFINGGELSNTYILFIALGLLLPCIYIFAKEVLFKFTIQTRDEVEHISGLPIVGTIERSDKKVDVVVRYYPKSGFSESFRSLRSKLEYLAQKESPISVLITSTEPGEGKTFVATNLASIYELTTKKVLVVDMDLRRPALSRQMGMEGKKGISNYLIGQASLESLIEVHPDYRFDVLPAGTIPPNPSELIRSPKTKQMIDGLMQKYDYIIFDCSPYGLVSDASFLSKYVDTVLYVVRNESTNKNFFKYTIKEFKEENDGKTGIVYNDVDMKSGQYRSKQYYGKSNYYHKKGSYYHEDIILNS